MPAIRLQDVTFRPETDSDEDSTFMRKLFCSLEQVQSLMQFGEQAELLIDMQLRSREQQYRVVYPDGSFQLILLNGEPVGRFATDQSNDTWHIIDIALMPACRGHLLGMRIVQQFLRSADAAGRAVAASVLASNVKARKLWQHVGFQVVDEKPDYWYLLFSPSRSDD